MGKEAIEKFLKEKKGYDEDDIADFWEWYLRAESCIELTQDDLDVFVSRKGVKINWTELNKIFKEVDRLFPGEKLDIILDNMEKSQPGCKELYYSIFKNRIC